jgi:hypothetical protein
VSFIDVAEGGADDLVASGVTFGVASRAALDGGSDASGATDSADGPADVPLVEQPTGSAADSITKKSVRVRREREYVGPGIESLFLPCKRSAS